MPKRPRLLIALVVFSAFGVLFCVAEKSSVSELKRCEFEIREVYFNETKDPNHVMLTINGTVGQSGFYKYVIHFPPQQGTSQGIGPIEVGRDEPCKNESCKPLNSCQEFQIKEFIARSYPDNVPEFGKSYFAVITFYLNDGSERKWQGSVEWKKTGSKITVKAVPGSATLSFSPFNPVDINTNLGFSEGHAGGLQFLYIPVTQLVWGYRVYLDFEGYAGDPKANGLIGNSWKRDPNYPNLYYRDFKAEYTLMSSGYYVQSDPQHIVVDELKANEWYNYKILPLCIISTPVNVDKNGTQFKYAVIRGATLYFIWVTADGNWGAVGEGCKDYRGYCEIFYEVGSGRFQAKSASGGGGGGGGLFT